MISVLPGHIKLFLLIFDEEITTGKMGHENIAPAGSGSGWPAGRLRPAGSSRRPAGRLAPAGPAGRPAGSGAGQPAPASRLWPAPAGRPAGSSRLRPACWLAPAGSVIRMDDSWL